METYLPCIPGHKHTDSAEARDSEPNTPWTCLCCGQEFANHAALVEASKWEADDELVEEGYDEYDEPAEPRPYWNGVPH